MHIYFSGIGGTGIGPLALIAHQAGYAVSGSDMQHSNYIEYLIKNGITDIHIGESYAEIEQRNLAQPIDWIVYSSAVPKTNPHHPVIEFGSQNGIRMSKRDEFLQEFLAKSNQQMLAIAGTHGKTTTTAMAIWLFKQLGEPMSYSVGAKLSYASMGAFDKNSTYFIYEADEYDRNFLAFTPAMSLISGVSYDHPDIYPSEEDYQAAFKQFFQQSEKLILWQDDAEKLHVETSDSATVLAIDTDLSVFHLKGDVNRKDAHLVAVMAEKLGLCSYKKAVEIMNDFPGLSRRFEEIAPNIISDYAHTPEKIAGAIQTAKEIAGDRVVVVYEGLHNTRQHFIRNQLKDLFKGTKKLFIVPSYQAREDEALELLTPRMLCDITEHPNLCEPAIMDDALKYVIKKHADEGDLVLCLTAGGGGSLDEWLRKELVT